MKVYLVQMDNGEVTHSDLYDQWIEKAFTTYRGAAQFLIDEGYSAYLDYDDYVNEYETGFFVEFEDGTEGEARIIEMDLEDK